MRQRNAALALSGKVNGRRLDSAAAVAGAYLLPVKLTDAGSLLAVALCCGACAAGLTAPTKGSTSGTSRTRPNIVWLVAEDLSARLPSFGDSTIATPHLSRLAAEGIRYPNTFSVSGVCSPSRAALATGMYPISIGAHHMRTQFNVAQLASLGLPEYGAVLPQGVLMLSQHLRRAGYYVTNNAKTDYQFQAPASAWDDSSPLADYRNRAPNQPFFAVYNFDVTHESQVWGAEAIHYRFRPGFPDSATLDLRYSAPMPEAQRPATDPGLAVALPPYLVDDAASREDLRRVYRNAKTMDEQVGFLLARLQADGLLDNTIIVWFTDHGGPLPREKRLLYDSGLRVPMIVRWPDGYRAGAIDSTLVSFVDFLPTTLAMAGAPRPEVVQGQVTFARSGNAPRRYVFAASDRLDEVYDRIRAVRDDRYKLLRNYYPDRPYYLPLAYREQMASMQSLLAGQRAGTLTFAQAQWFRPTKDSVELFDTRTDPYELRNLAENAAFAKTRQRLTAALDRHLAAVGDLGAIDEREMVRAWWGGQSDSMPVTEPVSFEATTYGLLLASPTPGAFVEYCWSDGDACDRWVPYWGAELRAEGQKRLVARAHRIGYRASPTAVE